MKKLVKNVSKIIGQNGMPDYILESITDLDCEVLVIGSGAGGATVGSKLAKEGFDVLMLEEGQSVPSEKVPDTLSESFLKMWRTGGMTLASGAWPVAYAEGCCVGGSTEINSAIFQRPPEELITKWAAKYSINDFSTKELAPFYDQAALLINASLTQGKLGAHSEILKRAGALQNWEVKPLERGHKNCVGTNHCSIGCPTGAKQSMSTSVLRQYIKNGGRLISNCRVNKVTRNKMIVKGAKAQVTGIDGRRHSINIRAKHVFVCGGATQTPKLLIRSGFKRGVGTGFKLHPTIRVLAEFGETVDAQKSRLPLYAITEFLPDYRLGGSVSSLPTYGMFLAEDWGLRSHMLPSYANMGMYYAMARGTGEGNIGAIPFSKHSFVRYQLSQEDWYNIEMGLHNLTMSLFESGARKIQPSISGMPAWNSMDEMRTAISNGLPRKQCNLMTIHMFSSIRIGENPKLSVANSFGKIFDATNLYVADASLIPESPGVNPQASVMALALRVAEKFIQQEKSEVF